MPVSTLGKWSVGLNTLFLVIIAVSLILVLVLKLLSFNDHWWDVTVPVAFVIEMVALYTGVRAARKYRDRSGLVYFSIFIGIVTILFVPLHSLFIKD